MTKRRDIRIAPSLLDCDFSRLAEQIALVEQDVEWLHLDIMDGHFVPNLSIGVPIVAAVRRCTDRFLDTHLMITDPGKYAEAFVKAGADGVTFHIEAADHPKQLIEQLRELGVKVGVSLNPGTPAKALWDIIGDVDLVLVMTVWPGFGGQSLITERLEAISAIAERLRPEQTLEVDGGVNAKTAPLVVQAGANMLVMGSAIFKVPDPRAALAELTRTARGAVSQPSAG